MDKGFSGTGVGVLVAVAAAVAVAAGVWVSVGSARMGTSIAVGSGVNTLAATRAGCG